ncbi:DUF294 nucleotidyltransferase-like domain-containing protein [uncultured Jatrophihabitans sp.]|uniref:DUF294 nucleotidyltransferase-like domain-containing protein n=1 Tax=uncultured Jatrophihabitans sp. TaxID=1610747 RepID=UPI0035CA9F58
MQDRTNNPRQTPQARRLDNELAELGITWTDTGMTVRRPAWCDTDAKWADYRTAVALSWREILDEALVEAQAGRSR